MSAEGLAALWGQVGLGAAGAGAGPTPDSNTISGEKAGSSVSDLTNSFSYGSMTLETALEKIQNDVQRLLSEVEPGAGALGLGLGANTGVKTHYHI